MTDSVSLLQSVCHRSLHQLQKVDRGLAITRPAQSPAPISNDSYRLPWRAVDYSPVSGARLQKTGILVHLRGDFREFGRRKVRTFSLQRFLATRKARNSQVFLIKKRKFSQNKNGWLGREDSNLRMVESKSGYLANEINMHSEQPAKFSPICINRLAGYSE